MPKVKPARKSIAMDMTAMCDVAFLLLTFFILTTKFKPDDAVAVDTPKSTSEVKLPQIDVMQIVINEDGKVFFGVDGTEHKDVLIRKMCSIYGVELTEEEIKLFTLLPNVVVPMRNMKQYLNLTPAERKSIKLNGIPYEDAETNELQNWVLWARQANPKYKICVKGDREMNYSAAKRVIDILQKQNVNKFNLITDLRAAPES